MGLLTGLLKATINVATLPIDITRDVIETSIGIDKKKSNVEKKFEKLSLEKIADDIFDGDTVL